MESVKLAEIGVLANKLKIFKGAINQIFKCLFVLLKYIKRSNMVDFEATIWWPMTYIESAETS